MRLITGSMSIYKFCRLIFWKVAFFKIGKEIEKALVHSYQRQGKSLAQGDEHILIKGETEIAPQNQSWVCLLSWNPGANQQVRITNCNFKTIIPTHALDCGDPTQDSRILPPPQHSRILPLTSKRKRSRHQDTPNQRRRVESKIAGRSLDNGAHLEGRLTLINIASDPTGDSAANEIKDDRAENRGSGAGPSEEGESKDKGGLKKRKFRRTASKNE